MTLKSENIGWSYFELKKDGSMGAYLGNDESAVIAEAGKNRTYAAVTSIDVICVPVKRFFLR